MAKRKLPDHISVRTYRTRDGRKRELYYVKFTDWQGKRRTIPAGDDAQVAVKLRNKLLEQNRLHHDFEAEERPLTNFTLWSDQWLVLNTHKRSAAKDKMSVSRLQAFFGTCRLSEISASRIEEYKAWRRTQLTKFNTAPKPGTINRELAVLRSLLVLASQDGLLEKRPIVRMLREYNQRDRLASEQEYRALLQHLPPALRPILIILWELGPRKEEVVGLPWSCVDLEHDTLTFEATKTERRTIPMSPRVKQVLSGIDRTGARVFSCTIHSFNWHYKQAKKQAGISGLWIHDFRRTFITRKYAEGWDYKRIMLITGHRSMIVHDRYNKPSFASLREVVNAASTQGYVDTSTGDTRAENQESP